MVNISYSVRVAWDSQEFNQYLMSFFSELLVKFASPEDEQIQNKILDRVSSYCGRPVTNYTLDEYPADYRRTFYHSLWFSFIVCSTLGRSFILHQKLLFHTDM